MNKRVVSLVTVLAALPVAALAKDVDASKLPPASTKSNVTYAADIKPILDVSCVKCHSGEKPKGRLSLTSLEGILKGGHDGKVVEPGNSASSMMVQSIAHLGDQDDWMPPLHNKAGIGPLTKDQIGLIRAWIDQGAK
ncbi:MAG: c-type cytochrome domain-containing protein [Verrucomicrobiota bacterium]